MRAMILSDAVRLALGEGRPVVALETSVLAHGLPVPRNLEAAHAMSTAIHHRGGEPAWTWTGDGVLHVGAAQSDLERLATGGAVAKVARRDLPQAIGRGLLGATTVSATLWAANAAGIEVMATGGIGGVHLGSGDVSADLLELSRTPGTVVCSGPKSIVDPAATLERLEELGVGVIGYRCDRLPFFLARQADLPLEHRADSPGELAATSLARRSLNIGSALLVCNPIPEGAALPADDVAAAVAECEQRRTREGVTGKAVTPFLLSCLAERTGGRSLEANLVLLEANAALAADVARALAGPEPRQLTTQVSPD
jgi:pseudouridine-5'-phosphate glycosidase